MLVFNVLGVNSSVFMQVKVKHCEERVQVVIKEEAEVVFHHIETVRVLFGEFTLDEYVMDQVLLEKQMGLIFCKVGFNMELDFLFREHFVYILDAFFVKGRSDFDKF